MATVARQRDALWFFDSLVEVVRLSQAGREGASVVEMTVPPDDMAPLHAQDEDEQIYVLEGGTTFYVGNDAIEAGAGQAVLVPKGTLHTHRAWADGARWLVVSESGRFEWFVRAVSRPADWPSLPPREGPLSYEEAEAVTRVALQHGIEYFGPPGTLPTDV